MSKIIETLQREQDAMFKKAMEKYQSSEQYWLEQNHFSQQVEQEEENEEGDGVYITEKNSNRAAKFQNVMLMFDKRDVQTQTDVYLLTSLIDEKFKELGPKY